MVMNVFNNKDICEILDIKLNRLKSWLFSGYIEPYTRATGSGTRHLYIKEDLYIINTFKYFVNFGFNRWISSKWSRYLDYYSWEKCKDLKPLWLIINNNSPQRKWEQNIDHIEYNLVSEPFDINYISGKGAVIVLDLSKTIEEVEEKIKKYEVKNGLHD